MVQDKNQNEVETEEAFYNRLIKITDSQTRVLAKLEQGLKARPTKQQGLAWIMAGFIIVLIVNGLMFNSVLNVSRDNGESGKIIKAATGCGNTKTVKQCEKAIAARSQSQYAPFLQQQDCLIRNALVAKPPPERYDVPCNLP